MRMTWLLASCIFSVCVCRGVVMLGTVRVLTGSDKEMPQSSKLPYKIKLGNHAQCMV